MRVCAAASIRDDVFPIEGDVGVCVEINNTDDVSVVWNEKGVRKTDEYMASLCPENAVVSVNITDDAPVVIGRVEAGVTVNMIVDVSIVETEVGV